MVKKKTPIEANDDEKLLAICLPHGGTFQQELSHLFWRIELPENYRPIYLAAQSTDIVTARNSLVKAALNEEQVEYVFFVDSDMGVSPSVPKRLIQKAEENDIKVLSALTFILQNGIPVPLTSSNNNVDEKSLDFISETGVIETESVGTGALLVHREVFESIEGPAFEQEYDSDGIRSQAEDYIFSQKAHEEGFSTYIDQDVIVDHYKKLSLKKMLSAISYAISVDSSSPEDFFKGI